MTEYRYSHVETIFGDKYWLVERRVLGLFWMDWRSFGSYSKLLDYIGQLKSNGNIVTEY